MNRRDFLQTTSLTALAAAAGSPSLADNAEAAPKLVPLTDRIALFTDHLDDSGFSYAEVAAMMRPLKIAGPDLTVRGGGIVLPERVTEELPKVAAAFRDQGMSIPMLSTNLTSAKDPTAAPTFAAMEKLGIKYFKLGYYHYHDLAKWESDLETQRKDLAALLDLSKKAGVQAGLHNHSGA